MLLIIPGLTLITYLRVLQYNSVYDVVVSGDQAGMLEYWSGPSHDYTFPKTVKFEYKTDTDLYEFVKVTPS